MPFVHIAGWVRARRRGRPGSPDNTLPGVEEPVDPDYGIEEGGGEEIGGGPILPPGFVMPPIALPRPPPGIWPPPVSIWPPVALPPDYPMPPGSIWPPVDRPPGRPDRPEHPGGPPVVGGGPVVPPPEAGQPLPSQKMLVAIVAVTAGGGPKVLGYTVVDPSLKPWPPLPPTAGPK